MTNDEQRQINHAFEEVVHRLTRLENDSMRREDEDHKRDERIRETSSIVSAHDYQITDLNRVVHRDDPPKQRTAHGSPWDMPSEVLRPKPSKNKRRPNPRRNTVIKWEDGTVTHAAPDMETPYDPYIGLVVCCAKRLHALERAKHWTSRSFSANVADAAIHYSNAGAPNVSSDEAYLLSVIGYGERAYALLSGRFDSNIRDGKPATFTELVWAVADHEVMANAQKKQRWFEKRLKEMREAASMPMAKAEHKAQLEKSRAEVIKEAEENGASHFEAWKVAQELIPDDGAIYARTAYVTEKEKRTIQALSMQDASAEVKSTREIVVELEIPF